MTSVNTSVLRDAKDKDPQGRVGRLQQADDRRSRRANHTGAQIKAFAIEDGVQIEPNFPLAVKHGNRFENVADTEVVKVHANMEFTAVAGDDNS